MFDFINPKNQNITLTGNMRQYREHPQSEEIKQFDQIQIKKLPNSKRTLIPYMNKENPENINHIKRSILTDKFTEGFISKSFQPVQGEIIPKQRKDASKIYKETSETGKKKELASNNLHQQYVVNSQINTLPGPKLCKRKEVEYDINTGNKYMIYFGNNNDNYKENLDINNGDKIYVDEINRYERKIQQNYNTNIACLPGCTLNQNEKIRSLVNNNKMRNMSHFTLGNNGAGLKRNLSGVKDIVVDESINNMPRKKITRTISHSNIDRGLNPVDGNIKFCGLNVAYKNQSQIIFG